MSHCLALDGQLWRPAGNGGLPGFSHARENEKQIRMEHSPDPAPPVPIVSSLASSTSSTSSTLSTKTEPNTGKLIKTFAFIGKALKLTACGPIKRANYARG